MVTLSEYNNYYLTDLKKTTYTQLIDKVVLNKNYRLFLFQKEILKKDYPHQIKIVFTENMLAGFLIQLIILETRKLDIEQLKEYKRIYFNNFNQSQKISFGIVLENELLNDTVQLTTTHYNTLALIKMLTNENSLEHIKNMDINRFLTFPHNENRINSIFLLKEYLSRFSIIDQERFLLRNGFVLWSYGFRETNDIDILIYDKPHNSYIMSEYDILREESIQHTSPFDIIIFSDSDTQYDNDYYSKIFEKMVNNSKTPKKEQITNPKYYYYFLGLKLYTFPFLLLNRQKRMSAATCADLIYYKKNYNPSYVIFPEEAMKANNIILSDILTKKFLYNINNKLFFRYNLMMNINDIHYMLTN